MQSKEPVRVAIIGTASRSSYMYGPILGALPEEVHLVSIWAPGETWFVHVPTADRSQTTRGSGNGIMNLPPRDWYSRCCLIISSAKFQASMST